MGFSIRQKELYRMTLEKSRESGQTPLYTAMELVKTNPEIFSGLRLQGIIRVVREVEKYLMVETMKKAAFGDDNHD